MRNLVAALVVMLVSAVSHAYIVVTPPSQGPLDYAKTTRVLLSGRGTDIGIQPQQSAMTAALLYHRNFPHDQVVMISVYEDASNKPLLAAAGWKTVVDNNLHLDTKTALVEIIKFQKIASLEIFGHNSATLGTQTDGRGFRFNVYEKGVSDLTSHFLPTAYAWVHGCNGGWLMAQDMSHVWGIPVAGAFTETRFEHLHTDGHYYVYETNPKAKQKSPSQAWATTSEFGVPCKFGGCIRMHPAFSFYNGEWGNFDGPMLPHYEFFCQGEMTDCEKRMAQALYAYPSEHSLKPTSTIEDFKAVAKDFLCPVYSDRKITNACNAALDAIANNSHEIHVSFIANAPQLSCTIRSCTGHMTCTDTKCKIADRESADSSTLAQEYMHFIRGYIAMHPGVH